MPEERPQSMDNFRLNPSGLGRLELPENVLLNIIEFAHAYSRLEAKGILTRKRARVEKCFLSEKSYPQHIGVYVYQHPAILNGVQSLAVTNQRLYALCRQWLWKHIEFPTSVPILMSHWIRDILTKHGKCVRSITMGFSESWFRSRSGSGLGSFDNTIESSDEFPPNREKEDWEDWYTKSRSLSPENAIRVLIKCPQLATLKIICPEVPKYYTTTGTATVTRVLNDRLAGFVAHLPSLRRLEIVSACPLLDEYISKIVEHLPFLESFIMSGYRYDYVPESKKLLGFALSKCKHLTCLHLYCFDPSIDFSLSEEAWPGIITDLYLNFHLRTSSHISSSDLNKLIRRLAPQITRLHLDFRTGAQVCTPDEGSLCDNLAFLPTVMSNLSTLKFLKIFVTNTGSEGLEIGSHPNLTQLTYHGLSESTWPIIPKLVCASSLPKLRFLDLRFINRSKLSDWEIYGAQENFHELCLRRGIKVRVDSEGWLD